MGDVSDREKQLEEALAGMLAWQAEYVNEMMPHELGDKVRSLLGEKVVDDIIYAPRRRG
jgi:hypothetical protein